MCWEHSTTDGVLRVNVSCGLDGTSGAPSYCAVGFHQQGDASTKMAPAEVFFLSVRNGAVTMEDRYDTTGHAEPVCAPVQISYDVSSAVDTDGSFWVAFSRNLNATGTDVYPLTPGSSHNLILAWGNGASPAGPCAMGFPEHKGHWKGVASV